MYLLFSNTFSVSPGQLVNELCFLSVGDSLRAEVPKINIYITVVDRLTGAHGTRAQNSGPIYGVFSLGF